MADDVVLNKTGIIERCLKRIDEEYEDDPSNLHEDITKQDAIVLNLQRACQAAIDLAMHLVREHDLGVPQESREAFARLDDHGCLDSELSRRLMRMVGFQNMADHAFQELNVEIVQAVVEHHLSDFTAFTEQVVKTHGFRQEGGRRDRAGGVLLLSRGSLGDHRVRGCSARGRRQDSERVASVAADSLAGKRHRESSGGSFAFMPVQSYRSLDSFSRSWVR